MSLYAKYVKEREGFETVENQYGFATYFIKAPECYLRDIYVVPEKREDGVASSLADEVTARAKESGCKFLIGSVSPTDPHATRNISVLVKYGMKLHKSFTDIIYFSKEIV